MVASSVFSDRLSARQFADGFRRLPSDGGSWTFQWDFCVAFVRYRAAGTAAGDTMAAAAAAGTDEISFKRANTN